MIWLLLLCIAGLLVLHNERMEFRARMVAALRGDQSLMRDLLDSGRKVAAAFLLILPGLVSDLMALVLLALPLNTHRGLAPQAAGRSSRREAIEGDYRRLD